MKPNLKIVGAIDPYHGQIGQDIGEIAGLRKRLGVILSGDSEKVLARTKPEVVIHTTGSSLQQVFPQLELLVKAKANVVSSTEELSFPYDKQPALASRIDRLAQKNKVTVLGTGVNPGFLMDAWPLFMTAVCAEVREVRISRVQDASQRRVPFQKKIGAGTTLEEFQKLVEDGTLRHVGLAESIAMIAAGLGWKLDKITETIEPIIAQGHVRSDYITIKPGNPAGVKQMGFGWKEGKAMITLDFRASIGSGESYDAIQVIGTPNLDVIIKEGTPGDTATAAILINSIPRVVAARPGLITMKDLVISAMPSS
jgi:4-hydroxy-tetrahydrodipicolinate reductase